jgi:hypothetical protein
MGKIYWKINRLTIFFTGRKMSLPLPNTAVQKNIAPPSTNSKKVFAALPPILDCPKKPSVLIFYSKFTFSPPVFAGEEFSATPPLPPSFSGVKKVFASANPSPKKSLPPIWLTSACSGKFCPSPYFSNSF